MLTWRGYERLFWRRKAPLCQRRSNYFSVRLELSVLSDAEQRKPGEHNSIRRLKRGGDELSVIRGH